MKKKTSSKGRTTAAVVETEKFAWRPGAERAFGSVDPNPIGRELERIYARHGHEVTPQLISEAALDPQSPLHPLIYHVDDDEAARLHYLDRARLLMRLNVKILVVGGEEQVVRVLQPVSRPLGSTVYKSLPDIMEDPEYRECMIRNAIRELVAVRRKFATLQELSLVFAAIEEVRKKKRIVA
jgi:hypothetical protein